MTDADPEAKLRCPICMSMGIVKSNRNIGKNADTMMRRSGFMAVQQSSGISASSGAAASAPYLENCKGTCTAMGGGRALGRNGPATCKKNSTNAKFRT